MILIEFINKVTKLNKTLFDTFQTNIKNAIDEVQSNVNNTNTNLEEMEKNIEIKTSLFKSDNGTSVEFSLSEDITNFDEIEIWYRGSSATEVETEKTEYCKRVRNINSNVNLDIIYRADASATQIQHARLKFDGKNVSFESNVYTNIYSNSNRIGSGVRIYITEVLGINKNGGIANE